MVAQPQPPNRFTISSRSSSRPKVPYLMNMASKSQEHSRLSRKLQTVVDQIPLQALHRMMTTGRRKYRVNQMAKAMVRY